MQKFIYFLFAFFSFKGLFNPKGSKDYRVFYFLT